MCKTVNDLDAVGSSSAVAFHEKELKHKFCKETSAAVIKGLIACLYLGGIPGGHTSFAKGGKNDPVPQSSILFPAL